MKSIKFSTQEKPNCNKTYTACLSLKPHIFSTDERIILLKTKVYLKEKKKKKSDIKYNKNHYPLVNQNLKVYKRNTLWSNILW